MSIKPNTLHAGDCLDLLKSIPDNSVDLVLCSPPYEDARTYGIDFKLRGQDWVEWAFARYIECVRVSRGLVAWVVEGKTKQFRYTATPVLLMADLHRAGVHFRHPHAFHRVGIPGSGGPDGWRNDFEFILVGSKGGKLPWSDNTATGHPPLWAPGGAMSNRTADGRRKNARDKSETVAARRDSYGFTAHNGEPSQTQRMNGAKRKKWGDGGSLPETKNGDAVRRIITKPRDGMHSQESTSYGEPVLANPGNCPQQTYTASEVVALLAEASDFRHYKVGGGVMGSRLCHENEAPYPEQLAEDYIRSFCPPGGIVLDPFIGSGTTAAAAIKHGRQYIGFDVRESQIDLTRRRLGIDEPATVIETVAEL